MTMSVHAIFNFSNFWGSGNTVSRLSVCFFVLVLQFSSCFFLRFSPFHLCSVALLISRSHLLANDARCVGALSGPRRC